MLTTRHSRMLCHMRSQCRVWHVWQRLIQQRAVFPACHQLAQPHQQRPVTVKQLLQLVQSRTALLRTLQRRLQQPVPGGTSFSRVPAASAPATRGASATERTACARHASFISSSITSVCGDEYDVSVSIAFFSRVVERNSVSKVLITGQYLS